MCLLPLVSLALRSDWSSFRVKGVLCVRCVRGVPCVCVARLLCFVRRVRPTGFSFPQPGALCLCCVPRLYYMSCAARLVCWCALCLLGVVLCAMCVLMRCKLRALDCASFPQPSAVYVPVVCICV